MSAGSATRPGDAEEALGALGRIVEAGFGRRAWLDHDTDLGPLRDLRRFQALLVKMQ